MWTFSSRGFLPNTDPVQKLVIKDEKYRPFAVTMENLASSLTDMVQAQKAREEIVCQLRDVVPLFDHDLFNSFGSPAMDERAFLVYSCFAVVYVNNYKDRPLSRLCKEVTIPIVRLAERVQRKPILDYCSYILFNWKRKNPSGPLTIDNLESLLTLSNTEEENKYIISRVAIEAKSSLFSGPFTLEQLSNCLSECNDLIKLSPKLPDYVNNYFNSFVKVKYDGWGWPDPQTFIGNAITQSSTIGKMARMLGLPYQDNDIRDYKPFHHRHALDATHNYRPGASKIVYNDCLVKFADLIDGMSSEIWNKFGFGKDKLLSEFSL